MNFSASSEAEAAVEVEASKAAAGPDMLNYLKEEVKRKM
jgi:hypothetical protein